VASYRAVVKHRLDAPPSEIVAALKQGLQDIAMELVGEYGVALGAVDSALEEALSAAEHEHEVRQHLESQEPDRHTINRVTGDEPEPFPAIDCDYGREPRDVSHLYPDAPEIVRPAIEKPPEPKQEKEPRNG
jgi:hypothetical protein